MQSVKEPRRARLATHAASGAGQRYPVGKIAGLRAIAQQRAGVNSACAGAWCNAAAQPDAILTGGRAR